MTSYAPDRESTVTAAVRQSRRYRQPRSSTASDASLSVRIVSAIWSCSPASSWLLCTLLGRFAEERVRDHWHRRHLLRPQARDPLHQQRRGRDGCAVQEAAVL